jgi:hypothetical protein
MSASTTVPDRAAAHFSLNQIRRANVDGAQAHLGGGGEHGILILEHVVGILADAVELGELDDAVARLVHELTAEKGEREGETEREREREREREGERERGQAEQADVEGV